MSIHLKNLSAQGMKNELMPESDSSGIQSSRKSYSTRALSEEGIKKIMEVKT